MRREVIVAAIVVVVAVAVVGVFLLTMSSPPQGQPDAGSPPASGRPASPEAPSTSQPGTAASAAAGPVPMAFTREGVAGAITSAVERPARPGRVQVAVRASGEARWVCILADGRERYVELDRGLRIEEFPGLQDAGFRPPPPQLSRATTSIYRSLAKRALGYDAARGDRIIIILCPRDQWPTLRLHWPAPAERAKHATGSAQNP